jgi:hypothetical protein
MSGKAKNWLINFPSKEQYHACLSTPQIVSYIKKYQPGESEEETNRYRCEIKLKKSTTVTNLKNIFYGYQVRISQVMIRTNNPVTRRSECITFYFSISNFNVLLDIKKKLKKIQLKEDEKKRKQDVRIWRLIKNLEV